MLAIQSAIEPPVTLFKEMALFRDLEDAELDQIAARFLDYAPSRGEQLYETGERAENFYVVVDGLLRCEHVDAAGKVTVTGLETGDVFGGRSLLLDGSPESRVKAVKISKLVYLPRADFISLLADYPILEQRLRLMAAGRRLKTEIDFDWLGSDEIVHFVARKHVAYLWTRITRAAGLAVAGLLVMLFAIGATAGSQFTWFLVSAALIFGGVAWAVWEYLDWRNDYYVISDQRVVWLEQVLLRSSSRIEAPLESIQAVNTHTSLLGQVSGYGDIILRTYTGTVLMPSVGNPMDVKYLIEEYISRARQNKRQERHDTIRQAVRESLGTAPQASVRSQQTPTLHLVDTTQRFSLFKTRSVDGDKIIYHKHWFTLFSGLLLPVVFLFAILVGARFLFGGLPSTGSEWFATLVALSVAGGVIAYRFIDWQNDIYLVTPENLMDSEKKPLGSLITKSAPLANVLSLENHRVGIFGLLFNFGVVRINVGDTALDFENVHDPAQVQQDIFARMEALKFKREQKQSDDERARMTEWLRVYEEERLRKPQPPANGQVPEKPGG